MQTSWIVIAVIAAFVLFLVAIYNRLVGLRQARKNAFADIDVQLKQRFDLVPNLVETVKGYATHERGVLENVTAARAQVGQAGSGVGTDRINAENALGGAIGRLLMVSENYPALQADQNFRQLQAELADLENKIAAARRFFNNTTSEYNTGVQQFPASVLAGLFKFHEEPFFEVDAADRKAVEAAPPVKF